MKSFSLFLFLLCFLLLMFLLLFFRNDGLLYSFYLRQVAFGYFYGWFLGFGGEKVSFLHCMHSRIELSLGC